jgi:hypothetical protein
MLFNRRLGVLCKGTRCAVQREWVCCAKGRGMLFNRGVGVLCKGTGCAVQRDGVCCSKGLGVLCKMKLQPNILIIVDNKMIFIFCHTN